MLLKINQSIKNTSMSNQILIKTKQKKRIFLMVKIPPTQYTEPFHKYKLLYGFKYSHLTLIIFLINLANLYMRS